MAKLSPVYTKIFLCDGQYRALGCNPHSLVKEFLTVVLEKLKIANSIGFSLYAVSTGTDGVSYPLAEKEKLCDIIGQWDSEQKRTSAKQLPFKLLFKRRLNP